MILSIQVPYKESKQVEDCFGNPIMGNIFIIPVVSGAARMTFAPVAFIYGGHARRWS